MQKAKDYLRSIRRVQLTIDENTLTIKELQQEYAKMTANYSGMPRSGRISDISDILARMEQCGERLQSLICKKYELISTITEEIERIGNSDYETFLIAYYVNHKSIKEIARSMHYSKRHIVRIHDKALREFERVNMSPNVTR